MNETSEREETQTRKRPRMTKSCTSCRSRKTRCDQQKPVCGSCTKRGKPELCHYEQHHWNITNVQSPTNNGIPSARFISDTNYKNRQPKEQYLVTMNERIKRLEQELIAQREKKDQDVAVEEDKPEDESDQTIDFYHSLCHNTVKLYQGPLSWVTLLHKDVYLHSLFLSSRTSIVVDHVKRQPESDGQKDFLRKWEIENVNLISENGNKKEKNFIASIKIAFKDMKLVWILVDKFFSSEFPLVMSFVDKNDFEKTISDLVGSRNEKTVKLKFTKKYQLSWIGILLLIMRMGSLTMYNFGKKPYFRNNQISKEDQYILDNPISKDIMHLITRCQNELKTLSEPLLCVFQFFLFREYFELYSPEECNCAAIANPGTIGKLLYYGFQCRLNRDPALIQEKTPDAIPKHNKNLLRRLWYKVVYLDSHQLMLSGSPPIIDSKFHDTDFPHLDECVDEYDYGMNSWFYERAKLYEVCYPLLMLILNIREKPKVAEIKKLVIPLIEFIQKLTPLQELLKKPSDTLLQRGKKYQEVTFLIDSQALLYMIYYHLFLYYNQIENKKESVTYLLKLLNITKELYPLNLFLEPKNLEFDLQKHFGCGVLLFPKIELMLHRFSEIFFSIIARCKSLKSIKPTINCQIMEKVDNIGEICTELGTLLVSRYVTISDTYYHAWVISKMHTFIISNLLQMTKGAFDESKIKKSDANFFESINLLKKHDSIFEQYDLNDFTLINGIFEEIRDIEDQSEILNNKLLNTWNSQLILDNSKRWLEQMLGNCDMHRSNSSTSTTPEGNSNNSNTNVPLNNMVNAPVNGNVINNYNNNVMPSNAEVILNSETDNTSLNNLLNVQGDPEMERLFYLWNSAYDSYL